MSPLVSLLLFLFCLIAIFYLFWPGIGLFWKWQQGRRSTERILIEDALKHLFDQEYKGWHCTIQSLAGVLSISSERAARLLSRLQALGLVNMSGSIFLLTDEGRHYALRMVRVHRLWERYLADETGVEEKEWHQKAEVLEHQMTEAETEQLAAAVGNATYDPHGDPIPTSTGNVPPPKGIPLTELKIGELARITHIEDEPELLYAQITAVGLHPGMKIQIIEKNAQRLRFVADGEEIILAPVVANQVTVESLPKEQGMEGPFENLSILKPGEKGRVIAISSVCRGQQRRRLMDLGIVPGTIIRMEMQSASGDPIAYLIRGAVIAIRKEQAKLINIERITENVVYESV